MTRNKLKSADNEDSTGVEQARADHDWITVRAFRLLQARGVELTVWDAKAVVDYVCEQEAVYALDLATRMQHRKGVLHQDILLLRAIAKLGHAPKQDETPRPSLPPAEAAGQDQVK